MNNTDFLESVIAEELAAVGSCRLEELRERLPSYSWSGIYSVVDRLTREGTLTLTYLDSSDDLVSLVSCRSTEARHMTAAESQAST